MRASVVAIAVALAGAGAAHAGPASAERARTLYETGKRHYDIAEYAQAIEAWKESYLLSKAPRLLFNIAQAHRLGGDCAEALRFYRSYLREVPQPANRAEIDGAIRQCARALAQAPPPPMEPPVIPPEPPPLAPPVEAPTPPVAIAQVSPTDVAAESTPGRSLRIAGVAVGAAGLAAIGAGVYFGISARGYETDVEALGGGQPWDESAQALDAAGRRAERNMIISYAVGGAAVIGGAVLWWVGRSQGHARVDVAITGDGAELAWSRAF